MAQIFEKKTVIATLEDRSDTRRSPQLNAVVESLSAADLPREISYQEVMTSRSHRESLQETFSVVSTDKKLGETEPSGAVTLEKDIDDLDDEEVETALKKNGHGLSRWRKRLLWTGRGIIGVGVVVGLLTPPPIVLIPFVVPAGLILMAIAVGSKKAWHDVKLTIHKTKLGVKRALVGTTRFVFGEERAGKVDAWCKRVMFSKKEKGKGKGKRT